MSNSKKISQLPPATTILSSSLIPVVNTVTGVTEKATISQLPIGITSLTNLGGGSTIGLITGGVLQLKTLVPGNGIAFTTTADTITVNNNLTVTTVGTGTSLINSFTNPNLTLRSIKVGTGLSVTSDSTSITISSTVNSSLDSIIGSIEIPLAKTYVLENYINKPYIVNRIYLSTAEGSATLRLKSLSATNIVINTSSTFTGTPARSDNLINSFSTGLGDQLVLEVQTTNIATNLAFTIDLTYI